MDKKILTFGDIEIEKKNKQKNKTKQTNKKHNQRNKTLG